MDVSLSSRTRSLAFHETLLDLLPPRSISDRTCFRRIAAWLRDAVAGGRFSEEIYPQVLTYAREAHGPDVRNPHALFMSILKKELGYDPKAQQH